MSEEIERKLDKIPIIKWLVRLLKKIKLPAFEGLSLYDLVEKWWPKYLTYNAYIDPSFEGTFSTVLDKENEYTFKSQYLVNIILTGKLNSNILGNSQDNKLTGNKGDNIITGGKGNDILNGGEGTDTAVFSGDYAAYKVEKTENKYTITDSIEGRDGKDELTNIEVLQFKDKKITNN